MYKNNVIQKKEEKNNSDSISSKQSRIILRDNLFYSLVLKEKKNQEKQIQEQNPEFSENSISDENSSFRNFYLNDEDLREFLKNSKKFIFENEFDYKKKNEILKKAKEKFSFDEKFEKAFLDFFNKIKLFYTTCVCMY